MKLSTNYSRSDWNRFIPTVLIESIPILFLFSATLYLFIPYIVNFTSFLDFTVNDDTMSRFSHYITDNNLQNGLLTSQDGFVVFVFLMWFG